MATMAKNTQRSFSATDGLGNGGNDMGTKRFPACAATIGTVILFALSGASQALAAPGGSGGDKPSATVICEPNGEGTVTTDPTTGVVTITCVIDQSVPAQPGQDNQARCIEESSAPATVELCTITQTTVTGENRAIVQQEINQTDGPTQTGSQRASITQTNGSGLNDATTEQDLKQSTDSAGSQIQTGDQGLRDADPGATILQTNSTGDNRLKLDQSLKQKEKTHSDTALLDQHGRQSAHLDQGLPTAAVTHASIKQDIDQKQDGPTASNQTQVADPHCCNLFSGMQVHVDLGQGVTQNAMMGAAQFADNDADCHVTPITAGTCNVREMINQNGATIRNTCNSPNCTTGQECLNGTCAVCQIGGEGGLFCPPPPECFPQSCGALAQGGTALNPAGTRTVAVRLAAVRPTRLLTT